MRWGLQRATERSVQSSKQPTTQPNRAGDWRDHQLPKGQRDPGETPDQAGYREAKEEAGLMDSDVLKVIDLGTFTLKGMMETYGIHFQAVETHKPKVSGTYHFETGETKWFTVEDAEKLIRKDQKQVLDKLISVLK